MPNFIIFTKLFVQLGYTVFSICDSRLITGDHRILVGCNTFLWGSRASSRDVTAIKKAIKIFLLTCKWSIDHEVATPTRLPYSAKRWRHKTLANQQNIALAKKTLANPQLGRSSRNLGRLMQAAGQQ